MTSTMIAENLCSVGYLCPTGSRSKFQNACPPGSYMSSMGQYESAAGVADQCDPCPAG